MRPPEFSEEEIIAAAERLQADGRRVTGFALRKEVGGGNPTRLANVWQEHRRRQEVVETEPVQDLPIEVEEALNEMTTGFLEQIRALAQNLNKKAVQTAERRVADVMATAKGQQESAEAELVDAAETVEDLEERLSTLQGQLQEVQGERDLGRDELKASAGALNELQRKHAVQGEKLEGERQQRKSAETKLNELQGLVNDLKADKADCKAQIEQLQVERERSRKDQEKLSQQLRDVRSERDNLIDTRAELKQQLGIVTEKYETEHQRFVQTDQALTQAQAEALELAKGVARYQAQAEQAQTQLNKLMAQLGQAPARPVAKGKKGSGETK